MRHSIWALLVVGACGDNLDDPIEATEVPPIVARCSDAELPALITGLEHVLDSNEVPCGDYVAGAARCFRVTMQQPTDHGEPDTSPVFPQRLFIAHRGCDRPMLVADWGYSQDYFFDDELSVLYRTNTIWIEHRYQGESIPDAADWDWTQLTINNGANDMHRVIDAFKHIYGANWVSTGASKGGITATYHHFYFPHDLDGTVPYVAPASRARVDTTYQTYLESTLPAPCADAVRDVQVAALTTRKPMLLARLTDVAAGWEESTLESTMRSFDWGFWQRYGKAYCNRVPSSASTDDAFWNFYADITGINEFGPRRDEEMSNGALQYEWLTEQGFALQTGAHIADLLEDPWATMSMEESFNEWYGVPLPAYDGSVTHAVRSWVKNHARNVLLIYGQYDPWSGGAFERPESSTSARFFVPGATHGARIADLSIFDRDLALAHATRMFGTAPDLTELPRAAEAASVRTRIIDGRIRDGLTIRP